MKKTIQIFFAVALYINAGSAVAAQINLTIEDLGNQLCGFTTTGSCIHVDTFLDFASAPLTSVDGIRIGEIQSSGIATLFTLGMDFELFTTSPVTILSSSANTMELDISGLKLGSVNGDIVIDIGSNSDPRDTGIATVICGNDCSNGDTYSLSYDHHYSIDTYEVTALRLEGHIQIIPIPASFWLLGSGILLLISIKRSKGILPVN